MYQWKGSVTYFMHPVDHVFIISIDDKRNKYFENKFCYIRVILFTIQNNLLSISKNGEKSIKIICILQINKALPHNYF